MIFFQKKENNFPHILSLMESYIDLINQNSSCFNKRNIDSINLINKNNSRYFQINSFQSLKLSDYPNSFIEKKN